MAALTACICSVNLLVVFIGGCDFFSITEDILVRVPRPPEHWLKAFPGLGFTLVYLDGSQEFQEIAVKHWSDSARIQCSKKRNAPVLAYPHYGEESGAAIRGILKPAGGLFPFGLSDTADIPELVLSWQDGPIAEVLRRLWENGLDSSLINSERLSEYVRSIPDPWEWDISRIAQGLAAGDFTARDIVRLPTVSIRIPISSGEWFTESPFSPVFPTSPAGLLVFPQMTFGKHSLFSTGGLRVEMYLDTRGVVVECSTGSLP
jgi:hypothetical protein